VTHHHHHLRGHSHGRLRGRWTLALFVVALGLVVGAGAAVASALGPTTKPLCQPYRECGAPPRVTHALVDETVWRSRRYGYTIEYAGDEASVTGQDPGGLILETRLDGGATGAVVIDALPASAASPSQAIAHQLGGLQGVSAIARDADPAHQLLGPSVGYLSGAGSTYVGDLPSPQGVGQPVSLASEAASDGHLVIAVTVVGPVHDSGPNSLLYQLADQIINSVRWPGSA
jgi:hypothetical protein